MFLLYNIYYNISFSFIKKDELLIFTIINFFLYILLLKLIIFKVIQYK